MIDVSYIDTKTKEILDNGYILALPTETVYGLGIRWDDQSAYISLYQLKKRKPTKPIAVMCGTNFDFDHWFVISENIKRVMNTFLPGPLTILIKAKTGVPFQATLGTNIVGIRIPKKKDLLDFLNGLSYPLQVTSANLSGKDALSDYDDVKECFKNDSSLKGIIKGTCDSSIPTTVVDLSGKEPRLVRQGEIQFEEIKKAYYGRGTTYENRIRM